MNRVEADPNHQFTYRYSQPEEYHFCLDSVIAPKLIASDVRSRYSSLTQLRTLDVCAGCGVMGFELGHYLPEVQQMDFIEIQNQFRPHFDANLTITKSLDRAFRFLNVSYSTLLNEESRERYDVIVANPPYFYPGDGKLTPIELKNRCRFFLDDSFETLVRGVAHALAPGGSAYLLVKSGEKHGRNSMEVVHNVAEGCSVERIADVRGTDLVRLSKPAKHNPR